MDCAYSKDYGVPQSRKRVFIVGYLDPRCAGKISTCRNSSSPALVQIVGGPTGSRIYDPEGVSCTIKSAVGGFGGRTGLYAVGFNRKEGITHPLKIAYALNASNFRGLNRNQSQNAVLKSNDICFIDLCAGNPKLTDTARCVTADYGKARMSLRKGELSGVLETDAACAVLTPDRENVRQQGRRIKNPEEPMFTLTAQDKHGVLLIKGNVRRGYHEAEPGDSVMLAYSTTNKRHTRVLKGLAHTLDTSGKEGVVTFTGRVRRLVPRECLRLQGFSEDQIDRILAVSSDARHISRQAIRSPSMSFVPSAYSSRPWMRC
jgi:DNA (cytosine-5)-methyltransferase 1